MARPCCIDYVPDLPIEVGPGRPLLLIAFVDRPSSKGHRLVISMQHCLYDGWSRALFMQELERAYISLPLQPQPVSSFVKHLKRTDEAAKEFWTQETTGLRFTPLPPLPSPTYTPHPSAVPTRKVAITKAALS